jgi:hypothetical protein
VTGAVEIARVLRLRAVARVVAELVAAMQRARRDADGGGA